MCRSYMQNYMSMNICLYHIMDIQKTLLSGGVFWGFFAGKIWTTLPPPPPTCEDVQNLGNPRIGKIWILYSGWSHVRMDL